MCWSSRLLPLVLMLTLLVTGCAVLRPKGSKPTPAKKTQETTSAKQRPKKTLPTKETPAPKKSDETPPSEPKSETQSEPVVEKKPEPQTPAPPPPSVSRPRGPSSIPAPKQVLVLTPPKGVAAKKPPEPPVAFSHRSHAASECRACHHTWSGNGPVPRCSAKGCHDLFSASTPQESRSIRSFERAFHAACIDCHMALKNQAQRTGGITCGDCHKKR